MAGGAHRVRENLAIVAGLEKAMVRNLPDPRVRASHDAGDSSQGLEAVAEKLDGFRGGAGLPAGPSPAFGWPRCAQDDSVRELPGRRVSRHGVTSVLFGGSVGWEGVREECSMWTKVLLRARSCCFWFD